LQSPAFSQIAITRSNGRTIYIGGQNAVTKDQKDHWQRRYCGADKMYSEKY
jgi:hypothetical protein